MTERQKDRTTTTKTENVVFHLKFCHPILRDGMTSKTSNTIKASKTSKTHKTSKTSKTRKTSKTSKTHKISKTSKTKYSNILNKNHK